MNCWPSGKYVHLLYMYSILSRGSFCFNYCLNSSWHGGDQFVSLLSWYGSPGFFNSGLQLICIVGSGVSLHRFSVGFRSGDQFVALLRWYGSPGFFDSGLQLICIVGSLVSHFPLDNTTYGAFPLHGTVRYGSVRFGLRFHCSLVPL